MDFATNWMIFGAFLLAQFGLVDGLFGSKEDDSAPAEEDADPDYDATRYGGETTGTEAADQATIAANPNGGAYFALGGADTVGGSSSGDYINGGPGNDVLNGEGGDDLMIGGDGADILNASHGADTVHGQSGNDTIDGSLGNDLLYGGSGNDQITGAGDSDTIYGGTGNDTLSSDRLDSLDKFDRGVDSLDGGAGDDLLILGDGDTGTGGAGSDTFNIIEVANPDQGPATITDFDPQTEQIQIYYRPVDGQDAPTPETSYDAAANMTRVSINGTALVQLPGQITLTDSNLKLYAQSG